MPYTKSHPQFGTVYKHRLHFLGRNLKQKSDVMPWKETTITEQKIEFICEWKTGKYTITELCKNFKISRPTAYKIIARFEKEGYDGLRELSKKPKQHILIQQIKK